MNSPRRQTRTALIIPLLLFAAALLTACNGDGGYGLHEYSWPVTIDNRSGRTVDIYLDERFVGSLAPATELTVFDVREGRHVLEAVAPGSGRIYATRGLFLDSAFVWILE